MFCLFVQAEVLIDKHADPTILNRNGSAGLDLACQYGHSQVWQVDLCFVDFACFRKVSFKMITLLYTPHYH